MATREHETDRTKPLPIDVTAESSARIRRGATNAFDPTEKLSRSPRASATNLRAPRMQSGSVPKPSSSAPNAESTVEALHRRVDRDPFDVFSWQLLRDRYVADGLHHRARYVSEVRAELDVADGTDRKLIRKFKPLVARARPRSLRASVLRSLDAKGSPDPIGDLLREIRHALPKIFAPQQANIGTEVRDRSLLGLLDQLERVTDARSYGITMSTGLNRQLNIEFTTPTTIVIASELRLKPVAEQAARIALPLLLLTNGFEALQKLTPHEIDVLLCAATRVILPDFGRELTNEDLLCDQAKIIQKSIPRKRRDTLQKLAADFATSPPQDVGRWCASTLAQHQRIAAILCDHLHSALAPLRVQSTTREQETVERMWTNEPRALDLLRSWASEEAFALRVHLGTLAPA
ncbi:MAG: hypothetical protein R3A47_11990 [Polyangiales bacterium]